MQTPITQDQAQNLINLLQASHAAQQRLADALQTLAPGIGDAILKEHEGSWYLTDEPEDEAADG